MEFRPLGSRRSSMSIPSQSSNPTASSLAIVGCSCLALGVSFVGLARFDLPITKYVRSVTIHLPWDQLTVPWMAFTSNLGDWIGQGWRLASLSLFLLAMAWAFEKPLLKSVAIQTLIAHGIAALLSNGLKHLIGRPRPKFVHAGDWQMSMSLTSGLDSFPSGHSTASFAIATVLAKRFPMWGPLWLAIAVFVGVSRVLRGSHFLTDVIGGAVLGILSGCVATASFMQWRTSLQHGLRYAAIAAASVFGVLWTLSHQMEDGITGVAYMALGVVSLVSGLWSRTGVWFPGSWCSEPTKQQATASVYLIAYGLAAMTTSPLVLSAVGFVCLASWFESSERRHEPSESAAKGSILQESAIIGSLLLALLILLDARGVLPF